MSVTIRNDRTGETITSPVSPADAAKRFAELFGDKQHWLWYHLYKAVQDYNPAMAVALRYVGDSFMLAIGYAAVRHAEAAAKADRDKKAGKKVKRVEMPRSPMIRVHCGARRFKVYLSRKGTVCLKSGALSAPAKGGCRKPVGDEEYMGCLLGGKFLQAQRGQSGDRNRPLRPLLPDEQAFLDGLQDDPVAFLARLSKDMGRCCYCYAALEDPRSKDVGYGPVCAGNWGLPWGDKDRAEKVPAFSEVYDAHAAGLLWEIRQSPTDPQRWAVFGDWLEEHRLPRCGVPATGTLLPRNDGEAKPVAPTGNGRTPTCCETGACEKPAAVVPPPPPSRNAADDTVPGETRRRIEAALEDHLTSRVEEKAEFARREAAQERAAFLSDPDLSPRANGNGAGGAVTVAAIPVTISSRDLDYHPESLTFSGRLRDLGIPVPGGLVAVKSSRTGAVRLFERQAGFQRTAAGAEYYVYWAEEGNYTLRLYV